MFHPTWLLKLKPLRPLSLSAHRWARRAGGAGTVAALQLITNQPHQPTPSCVRACIDRRHESAESRNVEDASSNCQTAIVFLTDGNTNVGLNTAEVCVVRFPHASFRFVRSKLLSVHVYACVYAYVRTNVQTYLRISCFMQCGVVYSFFFPPAESQALGWCCCCCGFPPVRLWSQRTYPVNIHASMSRSFLTPPRLTRLLRIHFLRLASVLPALLALLALPPPCAASFNPVVPTALKRPFLFLS